MTDDKFILDILALISRLGNYYYLILVSSLNRCPTAVDIFYEL